MPKHSKDKNAHAAALLGSPEKLIRPLVTDAQYGDYVVEKILHGGPPHKQLQHTLVLNRLEKLAKLLAKNKGYKAKRQDGGKDAEVGEEEIWTLSVQIPARSLEQIDKPEAVLTKMTKGPEHEILYTALLLQLIEGMILAEESK